MSYRIDEPAPGLFRAEVTLGFPVNAYLRVSAGQGMLVDTAWVVGGSTEHIDALFEAAKLSPKDLAAFVLTHAHTDHMGHAAELTKRFGMPAYLNAADKAVLRDLGYGLTLEGNQLVCNWLQRHGFTAAEASEIVADRWTRRLPPLAFPSRPLEHGQTLDLGTERWSVVGVPGHSPGQIALINPAKTLALGGDFVLPSGAGQVIVSAGVDCPQDRMGQHFQSIRAFAGFEGLLFPGHGPEMTDWRPHAARNIRYHRARLAGLIVALQDETLTLRDLVGSQIWRGRKFADLTPAARYQPIIETLARVIFLVAGRRLVETVDNDQVHRFRKAKRTAGMDL